MRAALACVLALALAAPSAAAAEKQTPERAYAEALRIAGEQPALGAELLAEFMRKYARHPRCPEPTGRRGHQQHAPCHGVTRSRSPWREPPPPSDGRPR